MGDHSNVSQLVKPSGALRVVDLSPTPKVQWESSGNYLLLTIEVDGVFKELPLLGTMLRMPNGMDGQIISIIQTWPNVGESLEPPSRVEIKLLFRSGSATEQAGKWVDGIRELISGGGQ